MPSIWSQLALFTAKSIILFILIVTLLIAFFAILSKSKGGNKKGRLKIKHLNETYENDAELILSGIKTKKEFKQYLKEKKALHKKKQDEKRKNIYVVDFQGDIKASGVDVLADTVTAVLNVATKDDEVVVRLENAGGYVHTHGLASAQLMRIRAQNIPLTIAIDKVAASGGYLMACVGNKILSAPFAIIGSIGVVIQLPNFHRVLKDKHVDMVQLTAGKYKRTVTMFGENTEEGKEKLKQEINEVHDLFKQTIHKNRPQVDIDKVATGEHWLGQLALELQLVDEIKTSDEYLLAQKNTANLYEIGYETKKSLLNKLVAGSAEWREKIFGSTFLK